MLSNLNDVTKMVEPHGYTVVVGSDREGETFRIFKGGLKCSKFYTYGQIMDIENNKEGFIPYINKIFAPRGKVIIKNTKEFEFTEKNIRDAFLFIRRLERKLHTYVRDNKEFYDVHTGTQHNLELTDLFNIVEKKVFELYGKVEDLEGKDCKRCIHISVKDFVNQANQKEKVEYQEYLRLKKKYEGKEVI